MKAEFVFLHVKELAEALVTRFSSLVPLVQGIKIIHKEIRSLMGFCCDRIYEEFIEEMNYSTAYLGRGGLFDSSLILSSRAS